MMRKLAAIVLLLWLPTAFAAGNPVNMLERTANSVISSLRANQANLKRKPGVVYNVVSRYMLPKVDVKGMSRSVLGGRIWAQATPSQRQRFSRQFTKLVIRTYAGAMAQYTNETVKFYPIRGGIGGKRRVQVNSVLMRTNGPNIPINYRVVRIGNSWKVYDMIVEGVSLLQSFRSQFKSLLRNQSLDQLIATITRRNQGRA